MGFALHKRLVHKAIFLHDIFAFFDLDTYILKVLFFDRTFS